MVTITVEVPDWVLELQNQTADEFACALRLAAAMFWYGRTEVSMGTAAAIAGMDITDFLYALSRHKQDIFVVDWDSLERELNRG